MDDCVVGRSCFCLWGRLGLLLWRAFLILCFYHYYAYYFVPHTSRDAVPFCHKTAILEVPYNDVAVYLLVGS
jgi:hypothetical protein